MPAVFGDQLVKCICRNGECQRLLVCDFFASAGNPFFIPIKKSIGLVFPEFKVALFLRDTDFYDFVFIDFERFLPSVGMQEYGISGTNRFSVFIGIGDVSDTAAHIFELCLAVFYFPPIYRNPFAVVMYAYVCDFFTCGV